MTYGIEPRRKRSSASSRRDESLDEAYEADNWLAGLRPGQPGRGSEPDPFSADPFVDDRAPSRSYDPPAGFGGATFDVPQAEPRSRAARRARDEAAPDYRVPDDEPPARGGRRRARDDEPTDYGMSPGYVARRSRDDGPPPPMPPRDRVPELTPIMKPMSAMPPQYAPTEPPPLTPIFPALGQPSAPPSSGRRRREEPVPEVPMQPARRGYDGFESTGDIRRPRPRPAGPPPAPAPPVPREPMPREPMPREPMPREPMPREPMPREPMPREPMPREPMPREPMPREPMPREPMPREPMPREAMPQSYAGPMSAPPRGRRSVPDETAFVQPVQPAHPPYDSREAPGRGDFTGEQRRDYTGEYRRGSTGEIRMDRSAEYRRERSGEFTTGGLRSVPAPPPPANIRTRDPIIDPVRVEKQHRPHRWIAALSVIGVLVLVAACGLGTYFMVNDERKGPAEASTGATQGPKTRDISSRAVDAAALTEAEVFPSDKIVAVPNEPPYQILKTQIAADCTVAAADDLGKLLVSQGCNQVVRATMKAPNGDYLITAGLFNLTDQTSAETAFNGVKPIIDAQKGRFVGMSVGPNTGTDAIVRAPTQLGWNFRGHFIAYCVIARTDGQAFAASDQFPNQITFDIVETYLEGTIIGKRATVADASTPPASPPGK